MAEAVPMEGSDRGGLPEIPPAKAGPSLEHSCFLIRFPKIAPRAPVRRLCSGRT